MAQRFTFMQVRALLRHVGMAITKNVSAGEYRVAPSGRGHEDVAYYTPHLDDALATGVDMAHRLQKFRANHGRHPHRSNPPGVVGTIPGQVEKIFYHRNGDTSHPGPYVHKFGKGAVMVAMKNGDIVIRSVRRKKLWGKY